MTTELKTSAEVGERIRGARVERGWSTRELAARLDVSAATVSAIENGKAGITVERLAAVAARLDMAMSALLRPAAAGRTPPAATEDWRRFSPLAIDAVLAAAIEEFVTTGYHGSTIRGIAARAGLSVPGLYYRYRSKQELLVTILDLTMDEIDWRTQAATDGLHEPLARLARLVESLALFHASRPELAFIGSSEMRSLAEPDRSRIASRRTAVQHRIDAEIDHAADCGDINVAFPREIGRAIATMCTSLPQWFDPAGPTPPAIIAHQYAAIALRMVQQETSHHQ